MVLLHQYQQNEHSSKKRNTMIYGISNPGTGLGQAQQCGRVKRVHGIPNLPSNNWISNDNTDNK